MVLFGKEIKLETNMSPKEAKLSLLIISLAVVIILGYFQIFIPIMDIKNLNNEIEMKKSEKIGEETKKKAAQREYDDRIQMYNEQNENYLMSKAKFDQSSLIDDTSLNNMIVEIAEALDIKVVERGIVEIGEENEEYEKRYIPYTLQTDINRLGRFFGSLELSQKSLITFKGSPLEIQLNENGDLSEIFTAKVKIGAYFNEVKPAVEKPVEEGKGGANE